MKKIVAIILAAVLLLTMAGCGVESESGNEKLITGLLGKKHPRIDEISYYFVNGVRYGEPVALMGFINNSDYTITSLKLRFVVREEATEEELTALNWLVDKEYIEQDEVRELTLEVNDYMVCDPGETVEGALCDVWGGLSATDTEQCDLFIINAASISYLGDDGMVHTVDYAAENDGYSVRDAVKTPFTWPDDERAGSIPKPDTRFLTILDNEDYLAFTAYDMSYENYNAYLEQCVEAGFVVDNQMSSYYTNDGGLRLTIEFISSQNAVFVRAEYV